MAAVENMQSDFDFFCRARGLLNQAEGNWLQRKLSWRSYTSVALSRFYFVCDDTDEVEVDGKPPPRDGQLFQGYQYASIKDLKHWRPHARLCQDTPQGHRISEARQEKTETYVSVDRHHLLAIISS